MSQTINNNEVIDHLPVDPGAVNEFVSGEIASWEGIRIQEPKGRVEFWLNHRCLGFLVYPPSKVAAAHLELTQEVFDDLMVSRRIRFYKKVQDSSSAWVSILMGTVSEVTFAIELFKHNYTTALGAI